MGWWVERWLSHGRQLLRDVQDASKATLAGDLRQDGMTDMRGTPSQMRRGDLRWMGVWTHDSDISVAR
jgi:hypothetical protein